MKLWLSRNSQVSLKTQLVTQIMLGIASGDLKTGEKLPSTRELARRFDLHQNTVSAAYRELVSQGWTEFRKGSGVYVTERNSTDNFDPLDALIAEFLSRAGSFGYSKADAVTRLVNGRSRAGSTEILVAEPNAALREIIVEEIRNATGRAVRGIDPADLRPEMLLQSQLAAMFDEESRLAPLLPEGTACIYLKANSVAGSLAGRQRPSADDLICIASGWDDFLELARLFLLAVDIDGDSIVTCRTCEPDWHRPLRQASLIICDSMTAARLAGDKRVKVFPLIAEDSLNELRSLS